MPGARLGLARRRWLVAAVTVVPLTVGGVAYCVMRSADPLQSCTSSRPDLAATTRIRADGARPLVMPRGDDGRSIRLSAVAFSADGAAVIGGGGYGVARVWDSAAGSGPVRSVCTMTGKEFHSDWEYGRQPVEVREVALGPGASLAATNTGGEDLRLWNVRTGRRIRDLSRQGQVQGLAVSADGRRVLAGASVSTGPFATTEIHDVDSGALLYTVPGPTATFSRDGRLLAVPVDDSRTLQIRDAADGDLLHAFTIRQHATGATDTPSRTDGPTATGDTSTLDVPALGEVRQQVHALAFSADGSTIVTASQSAIQVWDASSGRLLRRRPLPPGTVPSTLALDLDGTVLAFTAGNGAIQLVDTTTGKSRQLAFTANSVTVAPRGTALAIIDFNGNGWLIPLH